MSRPLQMDEAHHRNEVADVQTRRGWVKSAVPGHGAGAQSGGETFGMLEEELAPGEVKKRGGG